jgi:hypothetical protein
MSQAAVRALVLTTVVLHAEAGRMSGQLPAVTIVRYTFTPVRRSCGY